MSWSMSFTGKKEEVIVEVNKYEDAFAASVSDETLKITHQNLFYRAKKLLLDELELVSSSDKATGFITCTFYGSASLTQSSYGFDINIADKNGYVIY